MEPTGSYTHALLSTTLRYDNIRTVSTASYEYQHVIFHDVQVRTQAVSIADHTRHLVYLYAYTWCVFKRIYLVYVQSSNTVPGRRHHVTFVFCQTQFV